MQLKALKIFLLMVIIILVAGIFWFAKNPPEPGYTGPVDNITIGRIAKYPDMTIIAQEKGYFKENGLDVTFKEYENSPQMVKDLLAGTTDIVSLSAEFLLVRNTFSGEDLKILAAVAKTDDYWVLQARRDKGIQNISDLKGKRIGIQSKTINEFLLGQFLAWNGLDIGDVQVVDLQLTPRIDQLVSGQLDAIITSSPFTEQTAQILGANNIIWPAQGGRSVYNLTYATGSFINGHQAQVTRYLRALRKTEEFIKTKNADARGIVQKNLNYNDADIGAIWPKFNFGMGLEQELLLVMEDEARWAIKQKFTDKTKIPNYLDFIYFDALEHVKPEAVTIMH